MGQFIIRADASLEIGTGHVIRCLTLASALLEKGHDCHFICRDHRGNLSKRIRENGFGLSLLEKPKKSDKSDTTLAHSSWLGCSIEQDAAEVLAVLESLQFPEIDCLIVDHYALDINWEKLFQAYVSRLMVIDDLFDRKHDCDILINQNLGTTKAQYDKLVPSRCQILAGIDYAMLRPEFARFRRLSLDNKSQSNPKQLLITMGGVDPDNYTGRILEKLKACPGDSLEKIVIVLGETAPHKASIDRQIASLPIEVEVRIGVNNMAELMANADLAFGAAGSTSWERCCLGLPTLLLVIADNQSRSAELLEQHNAIVRVNIASTAEVFCAPVKRLLKDANFYKTTSQAAAALCDGEGVKRVVSCLSG